MTPQCQVCCERPSVAVVSSALGAVSVAYCLECAQSGAEQWEILVGTLALPLFDPTPEWVKDMIAPTCAARRKTEAEFWEAVAQARAEMRKDGY